MTAYALGLAKDTTVGAVVDSLANNTLKTSNSTDIEYTPVATSITASGDNTLYTPASGKRVRLHWVQAINDPMASTSTKITIKLGSNTYYVAWAISKTQRFTGPVDGPLIVNLSAPGNVAFTAFVEEVT